MSDTPITDACEKNFGEMPGVMRKLEKENVKLRKALKQIISMPPSDEPFAFDRAMHKIASEALRP